jgi:hypothetical protein
MALVQDAPISREDILQTPLELVHIDHAKVENGLAQFVNDLALSFVHRLTIPVLERGRSKDRP